MYDITQHLMLIHIYRSAATQVGTICIGYTDIPPYNQPNLT